MSLLIRVAQIQTLMPPGIQAEGSDQWGDLAEKSRREMSIWFLSQPEFTDQQLTVTAMFGSHIEKDLDDLMSVVFSFPVHFLSLVSHGKGFICKLTTCMNNMTE